MLKKRKRLYLCAGLQSSGSTLVSWCFLQRADMDGVLDADNDLLPSIDPDLGKPLTWYKTTTSCFRLSELVRHYQDEGWEIWPLLVVRDVRSVWASLLQKPYACNGITAEDPPLRMRVRRFVEDWELFRRRNWPTLRYESLLEDPESSLREACVRLQLPWDDAMLTWPKHPDELAEANWGNATFWSTRGKSLVETLARHAGQSGIDAIPAADLNWLESEFGEFNMVNGYPARIDISARRADPNARSVPCFERTRRYRWETKRKPVRWLLSCLGIPYRKLIVRRSLKKVA